MTLSPDQLLQDSREREGREEIAQSLEAAEKSRIEGARRLFDRQSSEGGS